MMVSVSDKVYWFLVLRELNFAVKGATDSEKNRPSVLVVLSKLIGFLPLKVLPIAHNSDRVHLWFVSGSLNLCDLRGR